MNRRGFALAAALLVVVLIAALVAGVFFAATEETHIAATASSRDAALRAAESAIESVISGWTDHSAQQIGVSGTQLSTFSAGIVSGTITVTRLDSSLYSIVAEARSPSSNNAAMRRIGVIVSAQNSVDHSIRIDPIPDRWWLEYL